MSDGFLGHGPEIDIKILSTSILSIDFTLQKASVSGFKVFYACLKYNQQMKS